LSQGLEAVCKGASGQGVWMGSQVRLIRVFKPNECPQVPDSLWFSYLYF